MQNRMIKALRTENRMIECSLNDHFVMRSPVAVAFFYSERIPQSLIINALEHVLTDFPIFAGVLVKVADKMYIDCNNQGVSLNTIKYDFSISGVMSQLLKQKSKAFVDLLDPFKTLKRKTPVLNIKLSYYKDATVIGYCWHHSIGDMFTFMQFVKALSAYAKNNSYQRPLIVDNRDEYLHQWSDKEVIQDKNHSKMVRLKLADIFHFVKYIYAARKAIHLYFTKDELISLQAAISAQAKAKVSRNDAICAHLLEIIRRSRYDSPEIYHASVIVNFRRRIDMPSSLLGNFIDAIPLTFDKTHMAGEIANVINLRVKNYLQENFSPSQNLKFVEMNGGMRNVYRILPRVLLPKYKNMIFTNWSNFEVYSIDFGLASPNLFLPIGESPIPWVSSIVEGFENKGALVSLVLPSRIIKRLSHSRLLKEIHQYRPDLSQEDAAIIKKNSWCR